jgi:hypothetical protein
MMNEITESEWSAKYRPIKNKFVKDDTTSFETYGEELDFVCQQPNSTVWTEMEGDEGVYIVAGYHLANRLNYYVTEIPWTDGEDPFVTICKYVDCDCSELSEHGDPTTDCEQCWGEGVYTEWSMD